MLYKGTQQDYQSQVADHAEHEEVLRDEGWLDYVDLPESEPEMKYASGGMADGVDPIGSGAFVPIEQFNDVAEKLSQSESEVSRLKEVIAKGMEENEQLRSRIAEFEVPVSTGAASEPVQAEQPVDYNSMTADQLRALLDEKGVAYKVRDSKPELIELLNGHSN